MIGRCLFGAAIGTLSGALLLGGCIGSVKTEGAPSAGSAGDSPSSSAGGSGAGIQGISSCKAARVDPEAQLVECANGMRHRAHASVCGRGTAGASQAGDEGSGGDSPIGLGVAPGLNRVCSSDDDCDPGTACLCNAACLLCSGGATGALCVLADCRTDADCGAGSYCALGFQSFPLGPQLGFSCLHDDDECTVDAECRNPQNKLCLQNGDRRVCSALPP